MREFTVAAVNFAHMHVGNLLQMVMKQPDMKLVGVSDESVERVTPVLKQLGLPLDLYVADYRELLEQTRPDLVILCPATAEHAEWTEKVAPFSSHIFMEKPFASSLADADRMIAAVAKTGRQLIINWPLRWYPPHVTAKRLVSEGAIGELIQVHYYGGNRGPLRHIGEIEAAPEAIPNAVKARSWWYQQQSGGGSLLDYLGYGATLGTWYMNGRAPVEVMTMTDRPDGLEVDEHSITLCRYDIPNSGLSKMETRWGTFSDTWQAQPQPKCGFVLVGRKGTISSYDRETVIRVQTDHERPAQEVPVDTLQPPCDGPLNYVVDRLRRGLPVEGPLSPAIARVGQQIVDAAVRSAAERRAVTLA